MLDDGIVIGRVTGHENRLLVAVGELHFAGDADDQLLAFVGRHLVNTICGELDAERIHMTVGLAERERVRRVAEHIRAFLRDGVRLEILRPRDNRIWLELIVHECTETLAKRTGKLRQNAEGRQDLPLLDRIDDLLVDPALLGEIEDAHVELLTVSTNAFADA